MSPGSPHRIAVLGTPSRPEQEWTHDVLASLRDWGFTAVQVNIAWSYRPLDEPLNLEDLIAVPGAPPALSDPDRTRSERLDVIARRVRSAAQAGLETVLHFGAPFQGRAGFDGSPLPQCVSDPRVLARYARAVADLARRLPLLDHLLVYTYDQDAWLCSEFEGCARCAGIPLSERLAPFLNGLARAWHAERPGGRLWWEPWELTAGQALATLALLDGDAVGAMVHSNIGEVMTAAPADLFVRNFAAAAADRGIPVVAEVFLSSSNEEVEPWRHLPVPLCTIGQIRAVEAVPGIAGVKEYFGLSPDTLDVNFAAALEYFDDPSIADQEILRRVARGFGASWAVRFWELASAAYLLYPWDLSWFVRQLGNSDPAHALSAAILRGAQSGASAWDTPAWRASRRGVFVRVTNDEPHPWQLEDARLRFDLAAQRMQDAVDFAAPRLPKTNDAAAEHLRSQVDDAMRFVIRCRAYVCHIEESHLASLARRASGPAERGALLARLDAVLARDEDNLRRERMLPRVDASPAANPLQVAERWVSPGGDGRERLREARDLLARDPAAFLERYFRPGRAEAAAGQFSVTSA